MTEAIEGHGQIRLEDGTVCRVRYQLQRHEGGEETRFTLTDGLIEIEEKLEGDKAIELEAGQELALSLAQPLRDGRDSLTLVVEPYSGHRPDERYQVSIKGESE